MKFLHLTILLLLVSACGILSVPKPCLDNYYRITDAGFTAIQRLDRDTVCTENSGFRRQGNCTLIQYMDSASSKSGQFGIALNFDIDWITTQPNSTHYGPYPNLGNMDSVSEFKIELISGGNRLDVSRHFYGDTSIHGYLAESKRSYSAGHVLSSCCYEPWYIESVPVLKSILNRKPNELQNISYHEYFFWLDNRQRDLLKGAESIRFSMLLIDPLQNSHRIEKTIHFSKNL